MRRRHLIQVIRATDVQRCSMEYGRSSQTLPLASCWLSMPCMSSCPMVPTRTIGVVLEALQSGDRIELLAGADSGPVIERFMNMPSSEPLCSEPLSQAAMDVLSIFAYEQPITYAEISNIRGTDDKWSSRHGSLQSCLRMTGVSAAADLVGALRGLAQRQVARNTTSSRCNAMSSAPSAVHGPIPDIAVSAAMNSRLADYSTPPRPGGRPTAVQRDHGVCQSSAMRGQLAACRKLLGSMASSSAGEGR